MRRAGGWSVLGLLLALSALAPAGYGNLTWDPLSAQDLASPPPPLEPGAPAEAIFRRITVNDSAFPAVRRIHTYARFRIFDPERAVDITRLALPSVSVGGRRYAHMEVSARLLTPDGRLQEFGRDALRERVALTSAGDKSWLSRLLGNNLEVKEEFLAISGIEAGSILEWQSDYSFQFPPRTFSLVLQEREYPQRALDFFYLQSNSDDWTFGRYVLNAGPAHAVGQSDEHHHTFRLLAANVPRQDSEPMAGPPMDYALSFITDYEPVYGTMVLYNTTQNYDLDLKHYPWSGYATECYMLEKDRIAGLSGRMSDLAAQITARADNAQAKARAIHDWVQELYLRYAHRLRRNQQHENARRIDDVARLDSKPDVVATGNDFIALEVGLDRAVGLEANTIMLPRRNLAPFSLKMVAPGFLPMLAARVKVGDQWQFSEPLSDTRYPFGLLPWESQGYVALVAGTQSQQFVPVPLSPAAQTQVVNSGTFALASDGVLTGKATLKLTGHRAQVARYQLRDADAEAQTRYFRRQLRDDLQRAEVTVDDVSGLADPYQPLTIAYHVRWPGYAELTNTRLIFRPSVFHGTQNSPFPPAPRYYAFRFPYQWQESDRVILTLAPGFSIEAKRMPSSLPGPVLDYRLGIAQEPGGGPIHYTRNFTSRLVATPASLAKAIYAYYDAIAARDQFELVAVRKAAPRQTDTGEAP